MEAQARALATKESPGAGRAGGPDAEEAARLVEEDAPGDEEGAPHVAEGAAATETRGSHVQAGP